MKIIRFLFFLTLSIIFFGINTFAAEKDMRTKTGEALSKQLNEWVLRNNPKFKDNLEKKLQKNKEQILKYFRKRQINEGVLTAFSIFSQAVMKKQIKYQRIVKKKELSINLEEDNLSFKVKFSY